MRFPVALSLLVLSCAEPPPTVCGGASLAPLTLAAGGRAEIPLGPLLLAELESISVEGLTTFREGDVLVVRGDYTAGSHELTARCRTGTLTSTLDVAPVSMTVLSDWDASTADAPGGREYFAWWADDAAIYLYGGFVFVPRQFTPSTEAFRFDLATSSWSSLPTSGALPPAGGRVATEGDRALYFGGGIPDARGALDTPPTLATVTYGADGMTFTDAAASGVIGSYTGAFVRDERRDRWLSVCGVDARVLGLHCRVHAYSEAGGFVPLEVEGEPPTGRFGFHYAMDEANDRVIVFGGQTGPGNLDLAGDTWALELAPEGGGAPRWVSLFSSSDGISPRRNGAFAYDPASRRFFVWGGTPDGLTAIGGLDVLTLDRGHEAWTHVELGAEIPPRASGGGVLDGARHRIVWGFGNSTEGIYTDLYALALSPQPEI